MPLDNDRNLLTLSQVAAFLGVKRRIVTAYVTERGLPVIRISRNTVRVDPRQLQEWLAERTEGATASLD
jgi:excisionase family DNA binding protein